MTSPAVHRPYRGVTADERRTQRRAAMVEAGLEMFGTIGYSHASVDAVCAEAGLTKRYFYESFDGLESLLLAVYDEATERVTRQVLVALESDAEQERSELALAGVGAFLRALDADRRVARVMFREVLGVSERVDQAYITASRNWETLMGSVVSELPDTGVPPDVLVAAGWSLVAGLALRWVMTDFGEPIGDVVTTARVVVARILGVTR